MSARDVPDKDALLASDSQSRLDSHDQELTVTLWLVPENDDRRMPVARLISKASPVQRERLAGRGIEPERPYFDHGLTGTTAESSSRCDEHPI
ncbi:hypothetical protein GCM10027562_29010 [Arthrobacter pigmenti]